MENTTDKNLEWDPYTITFSDFGVGFEVKYDPGSGKLYFFQEKPELDLSKKMVKNYFVLQEKDNFGKSVLGVSTSGKKAKDFLYDLMLKESLEEGRKHLKFGDKIKIVNNTGRALSPELSQLEKEVSE